ncbi:MAG: glycogen synthase, partial [Alphaproteobacteria bacterium]
DRAWFEFYGDVSLLKSAVLRASKVTTVSETYAAEFCGEAQGFGLNELLAGRGADLLGLVNGLDTAVWNPATDTALPLTYDEATFAAGKAAAKAALQQEQGLQSDPEKPVFGLVSRLSDQKGIDMIAEQIDGLVFRGAQVAILGSGDPALAAALTAKAKQHPTQVTFVDGYNEAFSHLIHAASDFLLVPSRFEPCGLTQLSAQRYGSVPVVSPVGGLVDTVIDANTAALRKGVGTGIIMREVSPAGLGQALDRALKLYQHSPDLMAQTTRNGMMADVGWDASAAGYADLFRSLI